MLKNHHIFSLLIRLWNNVNPSRRRQFVFLLLLTLITSVAEAISLGVIFPFIGIITQPERIFNSSFFAEIIHFFNFNSPSELVLPLALVFIATILLIGILRLILLWTSLHVGNVTGTDLGIDVYNKTLYQPYINHVERNSSEIISGITQKIGAVTSIIVAAVTLVTTSILFLAIAATLMIIDPVITSIAMLIFGVIYFFIAFNTRKRLSLNSSLISKQQNYVIKSLQEGLGAIRDVILHNGQKFYANSYREAALKLQSAIAENTFINQAPRFLMETIAMVLIGFIVLVLNFRNSNAISVIPILGTIILGAQRMLPLMQQIYGNYSLIIGNKSLLEDVLMLLEQPILESTSNFRRNPLVLNDLLEFKNVTFRYNINTSPILIESNLKIKKGSRVGFIGKSGAGKSTVLDLVMGLLPPSDGEILIDKLKLTSKNLKQWQSQIAHVPQVIYLIDATIAENIALGVSSNNIDYDILNEVATAAMLMDFIKNSQEGFSTLVGERGAKLSGGQRQRIGIARALYKRASVLIFDEATSALDTDTEEKIMSNISKLDKSITILMIAHRLSTLKNCDFLIKVTNKKIIQI